MVNLDRQAYLMSLNNPARRVIYLLWAGLVIGGCGTAHGNWTSLLNGSQRDSIESEIQFPLEIKWEINPSGYWGFRSSPAIYEGTVYIGTITGILYAVDARSGNVRWQKTVPDRIEHSSPAVDDRGVYVGCENGVVYAFGHDGRELWTVTTGAKIECSPIVVDGRLYIGNKAGDFFAIDATNGNSIWQTKCNGPVFARPTVADGAVFIGSEGFQGGTLYAFETGNGAERFTFRCGTIPGYDQARGSIYSAVLHAKGRIYFGSMDGLIYCLDSATGDKVWSRGFDKGIAGSPAMANGIIVIGVQDRHWYGLNAANGETAWKHATDRYYPNLRSPVIVNGIAIVQYEYQVLGLDLQTGEKVGNLEFTAEDGPCDGSATAVYGDRLYTCTRFKLLCLGNKP